MTMLKNARSLRASTLCAAAVAVAAVVAGCGGGGSSPPPAVFTSPSTPSTVPTAVPPATSAGGTLSTSSSSSTAVTVGPIGANGNILTVRAGASNPATTLTVAFTLTQPNNVPAPASLRRLAQTIGGANISVIGFAQITANPGTTLPGWPGFSFTFGSGQTLPDPTHSYVAVYDPSNSSAGFTTIEGPASASGSLFTWSGTTQPVTLLAGNTYTFVMFSTTSTLSTPTPTPTPTPTATPTATPSPSPTPTPAWGTLTSSVSQVAMTVAGQTATVNVSESNYLGTFTAANGAASCTGIATIAPPSTGGPSATFTITAVAAGNCSYVISDNHGGAVGVAVTVTTTTGGISAVNRKEH